MALSDIVPAATAGFRLAPPYAERHVVLSTVLPMAVPALVRADGTIYVALQTVSGSGDASRDIADALERALAAPPGTVVEQPGLPGAGPRLQDLVAGGEPPRVRVHAGFDYWVDESVLADAALAEHVRASLGRANAAVMPSARLAGVESAYWARAGAKELLRWVLPYAEEELLDALARLRAARDDAVGPGSRLLGTFRSHGLLVPVWQLPRGTEPDEVEDEAEAFGRRLREALGDSSPLTAEQRRARGGLANRQITIR